MAVANPSTGLPLRRVGGKRRGGRAIDATFSAPKSVSAVWALADPELRDPDRGGARARGRSRAHIRRRAGGHDPPTRRRDRVDHVKAAGLVATSWRHTTARAVADRRPTHNCTPTCCCTPPSARTARRSRSTRDRWLVHRRELAAAYRTELARGLTQLGFEIERGTGRGGRYFEIAGVPAAADRRWSTRHHQVQAAIRAPPRRQAAPAEARVALGGPDAAEAAARCRRSTIRPAQPGEDRYLASHTRTRKAPVTDGDLDRGWHHDGRDHGFDTRSAAQLHDGGARPLQPATTVELLDAAHRVRRDLHRPRSPRRRA